MPFDNMTTHSGAAIPWTLQVNKGITPERGKVDIWKDPLFRPMINSLNNLLAKCVVNCFDSHV